MGGQADLPNQRRSTTLRDKAIWGLTIGRLPTLERLSGIGANHPISAFGIKAGIGQSLL